MQPFTGDEAIQVRNLDPIFESDDFRHAAVRTAMGSEQRFSGVLWSAIGKLCQELDQHHHYANGMLVLPQSLIDDAYSPRTVTVEGIEINPDPFKCDILDLINLLVTLDFDHAFFDNDSGASQATSSPMHAIQAQYQKHEKLTNANLVKLKEIVDTHFKQLTREYGKLGKNHPDGVAVVLHQREKQLLSSLRISAALDDTFVSENHSYVWRKKDAVCVHLGPSVPKDNSPLKRFREAMLHGGFEKVARQFYATHEKYVSNGTRRVNGVTLDYPYLVYPAEPWIARAVIDLVSSLDNEAIIDSSIFTLARQPDHQPIPGSYSPEPAPAKRTNWAKKI